MQRGKKYAAAQAAASGAWDIEVFVNREDRSNSLRCPVDNDEEGSLKHKLFIKSVINISAVGRPWS